MRCESSDGWEEIPPRSGADVKTVVLVGKTGNGKSATGNSIIGRQVFDSMPSLGGVTSTCKLETTVLEDGQILNVIDTPGLYDSEVEPREMAKEIAQCINMAKDGIHADLLVLSLGSRFSEEEASAFQSLCQIFGGKIADYMIVVFAHGDVLRNDQCLDDLLGCRCPKLLMVESRLKESIQNLKKQLAEERAARMEAEVKAVALETKSKYEVLELKKSLKKAETMSKVEVQELKKSLKKAETKSKDEVQELKKCLKNAEKSRKQLEERLHRAESQKGGSQCVIL